MTECPLERQAGFPSLGKESVREYASRHAQLSLRGEQVFDRLLVLLPTHLKSQPTSRVSPFPSAFLFSICDALQHGPADGSAQRIDTSVLPSVLSKLRDWRLLDPDYRYSPGGLYKLALDLAGITDEASASTSSDVKRTSHARLRMKWVSSDSPSESQDREPSPSLATPPSPSPSRSSVLDSAQECAHAPPDLNERRSDAGYVSCQVARLGTPDSEDASAVVSRRLHSVSGFRSGCSACRHLRVSGPSTPPSPRMVSLEQRTPFSNVNQFNTNITTTVPSPRHPKPSVQHTTTKKTRREKHKPLQSISHGAHVDENEPPLPTSIGVQRGIGISFPRQRTHYRRISNILSSRDSYSSPAATPVERRIEPSHLPNRTREGDKHMFSHRVASVDFRLPITDHASPIDLHPHPPTRAQSLSYTPVNPHGLGSVAARVQKLPSNAVGSRSSKRLPSWSQSHLRRPPTTTTTTTTTSVKPTSSLSFSPSPAKASLENSHLFTRLRPWSTSIPPRVPSGMTHRDRRAVSSQTHKHTQSAGSLPLSPLLHARKWQV